MNGQIQSDGSKILDAEKKIRGLHSDLERFKRSVFEFEDRLEQQKAVKESLRQKVKENEEAYHEMSQKKQLAAQECKDALSEVSMFRDDVAYLT